MIDYCGNTNCKNEVVDPKRKCINCYTPLCWDHVVRVSVAVHEDGTVFEHPFYLCRFCADELFLKLLMKKRVDSKNDLICAQLGVMCKVIHNDR